MQRNYIVFVLLSVLVLAGWYLFVAPMGTTKKKDVDKKEIAKVEPPKTVVKDKEVKEPKKEMKEPKKDIKEEKKPPAVLEKAEPLHEETLGGAGYHLTVETISRGAGVCKLTLNRFNAADWRGRPTNPPRLLELIQEDKLTPSYRMYHYASPSDQNPVLGLGEKIWKFEGRDSLPDEVQEVRYSTTVPGMEHIKIVKTYRLAPPDYHVTLLLEFHDLRDPKDKNAGEVSFRYQIVGATGLPIEGEWYASTFRNAIIGMTDKGNNLWRQLEDSPRIAGRKGGDRFPDANRGDFKMQYAGVANQYFAAMIVVDDKQPRRDEGGVEPGKIVAWARPTLETTERAGVISKFMGDAILFQEPSLSYKLTEKAQQQVEAINVVKARRMILSYRYTIKGARVATWVRAEDDPRPPFDEKEADSHDIHGLVAGLNAKDISFREDAQRYQLLPRTERHIADLELKENQLIALNFYVKPDGTRVATWARLGETPRPQFDDITVRVNSEPVPLAPKDKVAHQFLLYHGPVKAALLAQQSGDREVPPELVERYTDTLHLNTLTDYHSDNFFGRASNFIGLTRLIIWVTRFMHWLFYLLHSFLPYGLCIMVLTVVVRGCMFPISRRQALFSIKMQALAPEMKKIAEKYKDDLQARSQATSELQKKHGVHPLSSCWPVFLQMPIFLGLYFAMQESIHFRLADFLWIENLAAPDMLFWWSEQIPFISTPDSMGNMLYLGPYFNLLPMVAVALMMVQQMQTMPPAVDEQQAMQQKMMKYMTIVFGVMFYKVAAGLCIYFIASSLWGCAERMLLPKKKAVPVDGSAGTPPPPVAPPNSKWKKKNTKPEKKEESGLMGKAMAWWEEVRRQAEKK